MSANEHAVSEYIGKMRKKLKELTNRKMSPSDAYNDHCVGEVEGRASLAEEMLNDLEEFENKVKYNDDWKPAEVI